MKIVRVDTDVDDITYGAVEAEGIRIYRGTPFVAWEPTETVVEWEHARLLAPVIPTKIVAVGKNYADQAEEVHHEAELAVVIGRVTRNVKIEDVGPHIMGYTAANDVTARDLQRADGQWTRAKGFDTFCPLGPAIDTDVDPLEGLSVISRVNGEIRQSGTTADLVFGVSELVSFISSIMTLLPGDVILTGTPSGVGPIVAGDRVEVEIEGVGILVNPVVRG